MTYLAARSSLALLAVASIAPAGAACGGSSTHGTGADAGPSDASQHADVSAAAEGGSGDDGGVVGQLPEGGIGPHGTQLVASTTALVAGVTTDGYVLYTDTTADEYFAVPLAGGTPAMIGASDGTAEFVSGPVGFAFNGFDPNAGTAALTIWTSAHGAQPIGSAVLGANIKQGQLDVSSDGAHLLYFDNVTAAGTADITVIDTDGTNKAVLVPSVDLTSTTCFPSAFFAGAYAVVESCPASDAGAPTADGGVASNASLVAFTGAGWAASKTLSTAATPVGLLPDPTGASVLYLSSAGLQVASLATGQSAVIDAMGTRGAFTGDGQHVVYVAGGAVSLAASTGGTPTPLLAAAGYQGILALSPDDKWVLAGKTTAMDGVGDTLSDLFLGSITAAGAATAVASVPTAALFGDPFTADSSHLVYTASVTNGTGTLTSVPTAGGSPVSLGSSIWTNSSSTAAKVVFNTNFTQGGGGGGNGEADLEAVDTSAAAPAPTLLVTQADAFFYLDAAKSKVVYSWSYLPDSTAGVWVLPLP